MKTFAINLLNELAEECEKKLATASDKERAVFLDKVSKELTEVVEGLVKDDHEFSDSRIPRKSQNDK